MNKNHPRIVIIRGFGNVIDENSYNCQELGLGKALCAKGYSVNVILAGNGKLEQKIVEVPFGQIVITRISYLKLPFGQSLFYDFFKILSEFNPDIIQVQEVNQLMSLKASYWCRKRGVPLIVCQGAYQNSQNHFYKIAQIIFNKFIINLIRNNVSAICAKTLDAQKYLKILGFDNVSLTPIGIDISRLDNSGYTNWETQLKICEKQKILLYVGKIEKRRNPFYLIDLINELGNEWTLIFIGDGPLKKASIAKASKLNLSGRIHFLGKIKQEALPNFYKASQFLVLPSNYEIFGMVIMEAMYFGLPVLTTNTAGAKTIIQHKVNGLLLDLKIDNWVKEINYFDKNPDEKKILSENAKKNILDNFLWEKTVMNFINLYNRYLKSLVVRYNSNKFN